jgi:DNA-binding GntR family transcriptional regulator
MVTFQFKNQVASSFRQRATNEIRAAIIRGDLKPGDKLKELEIAEQMGISRGPLREAIRDLEAMGLVVTLPYRETIVANVTKEEVIDLLIPIRLQLELFSIKYNKDRFDQSLFDSLNTSIAEMEEYARQGDVYALVEADIRFHETILMFNESLYGKQIWSGLVNRLRLHFIQNTGQFSDLKRVPSDHRTLITALRSNQFDIIAKEWEQHIKHEDCLMCFQR